MYRDPKKSIIPVFTAVLFLLTSCSTLTVNPPGPGTQSLLILPVQDTDKSLRRGALHGFYYVYEIVSSDDSVAPYRAEFKLPLKDGMLIVDSLPPGEYFVEKFFFLPIGTSDHTFGRNEFPRNDRIVLKPGEFTVFSKSLNVLRYTKLPSHGRTTEYRVDMQPVTADQYDELMKTLRKFPGFKHWK